MRFLPTATIALILIALCQCAFAQPGYLGRLNIIQADVYARPGNLFRLNSYDLVLHHSESISFNRVMSRRTMIGAGFTFMQPPRGYDQGTVRSMSLGIVLQCKWYPFLSHGKLAPIGPYIRVAVNANRESSTWTSSVTSESLPWEKHFWMGYQAEFGKTTLIGGHVPLDVGFRVCAADLVNSFTYLDRTQDVAKAIRNSEFLKLHLGLGYLF